MENYFSGKTAGSRRYKILIRRGEQILNYTAGKGVIVEGLSLAFWGFKSEFEECPFGSRFFQTFRKITLQGGGSEDQYFHS
ncbi:MAG: hypothetical protein Ct9H300mP21_01930 [Pseudomonadota bacterium]|nr:MAG: hypothetical protein Ct9H300mP21_01930 [Pseudomonadota bacterium]